MWAETVSIALKIIFNRSLLFGEISSYLKRANLINLYMYLTLYRSHIIQWLNICICWMKERKKGKTLWKKTKKAFIHSFLLIFHNTALIWVYYLWIKVTCIVLLFWTLVEIRLKKFKVWKKFVFFLFANECASTSILTLLADIFFCLFWILVFYVYSL